MKGDQQMQPKARVPAIGSLLAITIPLLLLCCACQGTGQSGLLGQLGLGGSPAGVIQASGTIETDEVVIASEFGGRVREILVDEGQEVETGAVVIRLDTDLLDSQMGEAQAATVAAGANLALVEAGARPGELATAQALLQQAIAARDGAEQAWKDAMAVRDDPQELNATIDDARAQVQLAEHNVAQAQAQLQTAIIQRDAYAGAGDDESKTQYQALDQQVQAAEAGVAVAEEEVTGAETNLQDLLDVLENPIELDTAVNQAKAQYDASASAVEVAEAALEALQGKPTPEELAVARAQLSQAEAAMGILQVQKEKMTLHAPLSGLVTNISLHVGETAAAGATLMTVANLDEVKLTVYIPENRYGRIQLGQDVRVEADSYPGKVYQGQVIFIASEAEFTPRNVQTKEERVNTVFAVKVLIPNPDHDLKPGMPADATIMVE
jgi:HlyD family secretion protein